MYLECVVIKIPLTVKEALNIGAFKQCTLLAGEKGLKQNVSYISSMEVPDVKTWVVKKQLLITTAYSIRNSPEELGAIIRALSLSGASGLGLKTKFIGQIPSDLIRLADEFQMPLIQIPEHIPFIDIIAPIMKAIINEQNIKLEFSQKIYTKLIELNLAEGGLPNITDFIFDAIGTPAAITDHHFAILSSAAPAAFSFDSFVDSHTTLLEKFLDEKQLLTTIHTVENTLYLLRKILIKNKICGCIILQATQKMPDETSLIVVEHAATAAALEFSKAQALQKQIKMMENSFYLDLITENVKNEEEAYSRAASLSWPKLPLTLVVFNIDHFEHISTAKNETEIFQIKDNIRQIIHKCFESLSSLFPIISNSDSFSCLLPNQITKEKLTDTIKRTLQAVLKKTNLQMTAGIRRNIENYTNLKTAENDAVESIYICRREKHAKKFIFAENIKLEKALLTVIDNPAIREFTDSTIGQLLHYDKKNHTQLTRTLEEFIKCMGARAETAKNLYIHRNTLTQRLKKIESIVGYNLSHSGDLLSLGIAIKMQRFLD